MELLGVELVSQVHRSASVPMIRTSITIPFRANFAFK